jgi:phosphate transport system substrate-binding protein
MAALYSKICGVSLEEAQTFVQVSGGTGAAWLNMSWGGAELLLVYEAPESIKEEMMRMGYWDQLEIDPIGRDGLVFIVNENNPVDSLTREQLIGIYSGAITDWAEVGGNPGPIAAFQRNIESGSQTLFLSLLMGDTEPMDAPTELRPGGMGGLMEAVSEFDGSGGAIGFSVFYYADLMYDAPNLKIISVDGIAPGSGSIGSGQYPLVNDFYVVIQKFQQPDSPARVLRDWFLTDEARQFMRELKYVPAEPG